MEDFYSIEVTDIKGETFAMERFRGKVLLIVNVASQCGFTPQYAGLEALWREFGPERFVVLGFPCNQFGSQEPGTEAEIQTFCETRFSVSFPLFHKVEVNGEGTHPLFKYLKSHGKGLLGTEAIKWNFTKFLVSADGRVQERYAPTTSPESLRQPVAALLSSAG